MHKLPCLFAVLAMGSLAVSAGPSAASPLGSALRSGNVIAAELQDGPVQKVHRWHCQRRKGWYRGKARWHRHPRACRDYGYVHPYPDYNYGAPLPYYGYWDWRRERSNWLFDD
jgi:hypothetical protein